MSFPADFPNVGVWQITFYDDNDEPDTLYAQHVSVSEKLDHFYLMRLKTEHGWDYRRGERSNKLRQLRNGNWSIATWNSCIVITSAVKIE